MSLLGQIARVTQGASPRAPKTRRMYRSDAIPPSVLGWNRRDPLFEMQPGYATILDNYVPREGFIGLRGGNTIHASGIGGAVETLFSYESGGNSDLLAIGNGSVYDATGAGAVGAALASGFSEDRWQGVNFNGFGLLVNGTDAPHTYNGTTFAPTTLQNAVGQPALTISNLIGVHVFKRRVFYIENNTARFWYHATVDAVSGDLEAFDLSTVTARGGTLRAIGTLTNDGGEGVDDLAAFFMSSGDVLIYSGTDPGDTAAWALVGIFHIAPPIGRRPLLRIGADLVAITVDGYVPLLQFLKQGRSAAKLALSDNISGEVSDRGRELGDNDGWEAIFYPRGNLLLFNVPTIENSRAVQHVFNTNSRAWCQFKGLDAATWAIHQERAYFGSGDGTVRLYDNTRADNGLPIVGDIQSAYIYFGGRGAEKRFLNIRPNLSADTMLSLFIGLGLDFQEEIETTPIAVAAQSGGKWNAFKWNTTPWGGGLFVQNDWRSIGGVGQTAAVRLVTESTGAEIRVFATDISYEIGDLF